MCRRFDLRPLFRTGILDAIPHDDIRKEGRSCRRSVRWLPPWLVAVLAVTALPSLALAKDKFTLAVSIYAGWMPWYYAKDHGILKKWAERYKITIDVVEMDYIPSVEAYVAGKVDAGVMTNMEALAMPAKSGIDTTVVIVGDYSNGNDALLVRGIPDVKGLKGTEVYLVELSVSHYLLARALEMHGVKESELKVVNTSDSDIAPAFIANKSQKAVVTWNPMVMSIEQTPGVSRIFDSSKIPGEVLDLLVVNTKVLNDDPRFGGGPGGGLVRGDESDVAAWSRGRQGDDRHGTTLECLAQRVQGPAADHGHVLDPGSGQRLCARLRDQGENGLCPQLLLQVRPPRRECPQR